MNTLTQNSLTQLHLTQERRTRTVVLNPFDYPLIYWRTADEAVDDGAGLISAWTDKSENGYTPIAATTARPTRVLSALNGYPGIYFNGTTNYMYKAFGTTYAQPFTKFIVWAITGTTLGTQYVNGGTLGSRSDTTLSLVSGIGMYAGAAMNYAKSIPFAALTTTSVFNGASSKIYENGVLKLSSDAGTESMLDIWVGCAGYNSPTPVGFLKGYIYEEICVQGLMSSEDITLFNAYLQSKYDHY